MDKSVFTTVFIILTTHYTLTVTFPMSTDQAAFYSIIASLDQGPWQFAPH